jgi:DNA-binding XRE family transcriptional regulator
MNRSVEYWAGWALAYYQWQSGMSYKNIYDSGIKLTDITDMYILHEAPDEKFVEIMFEKMKDCHKGNMLKRLRKYCGLTQKELSEATGVSLRMIQLYEQGQNDITKAQAGVVQSLADVLGTDAKELILQ